MSRRRGFTGRNLTFGRSFESTVGKRSSEKDPKGSFFERLLRVTLHHDYYNDSQGLAPDYEIWPTAFTDYQMRSLGLRLRWEESGVSVLYDVSRQELLLRYLKRQAEAEGSPGAWFRLSFAVALRNPYFLNFTALDISSNPAQENFYYTNHQPDSAPPDPELLQPEGPWKVVPVQLPLAVCPDGIEPEKVCQVAAVEILDIAGQVVECKPRCASPLLLPADVSLKDARCSDLEYLTTDCDNDTIFLDFGLLREDKYELREIGKDGRPLAEPVPVIYTVTFPQPFAFVDLLLSRPDPTAPGVYPVRGDFTEIEPVRYRIDFASRSTVWRYYVVPQNQRPLENVLIEQWERPEPPYRVTFTPAKKVPVPGGEWAYRLESEQELTLLRESPWRFRLQAERGDSTVRIERMPVASVEQVLPECVRYDDNGLCVQRVNYSDVYVTV